jgi:hypothetical protein
MKNGNQCPILKPSPLPFVYFENDVCVDVYNILSLLRSHFAREALSLYGIARLHLANMLITLGVQLPIFLVLQNAC